MRKRLGSIKLDNYKPLREIVFETLRNAIISGKFEPGERFMEIQLAEELGVSRTPVREAIRKLEREGLLVMVPRKGAYVAGLSLKDVADVFEIRGSLEGLAGSLAAERATDEEIEQLERILVHLKEAALANDADTVIEKDTELHDILFNAARNDKLVQILNNLREQIHIYRLASLKNPERFKEMLIEHKKIVEAIADRDSDRAQKLVQEHIENVENNIMQAIRKEKE
jgi:DNA-binding GntR family transcriptional regulator